MEAMQVFDLRCRNCSWKRLQVVTPEYARTLQIQHEFKYFEHTVEVAA